MAPPSISKAEALRRKRLIEDALRKGYPPPGIRSKGKAALAIACDADRVPYGSRSSYIGSMKNIGIEPNWTLYKPDKKTADEIDPIVRRSLTDDLKKERARVADLERELSQLRNLRQSLFNLGPPKLDPPKWQIATPNKKHSAEVPILFTSDFQVGEVIKSKEVSGWNTYNPDIFKRRYRRLIDTTIELCRREDPQWRYPGIVYLRGGDSISGSIHMDLEATQDLVPPEQAMLVAEEEAAGIERLEKEFGNVSVFSVPGNHDRTTLKTRSKKTVRLSFDNMILWHLRKHFETKKKTGVTFTGPESADAYFSVYNTKFLMTHGDAIGSRGGQGMVGPAATISRGFQKVRQQYAHVGKMIDYVLIGHFHVPMLLESGISNGNLAGFSEYANREMRARPEPPSQWLFWVHPKWGITTHRLIKLEEPAINAKAPWIQLEAS